MVSFLCIVVSSRLSIVRSSMSEFLRKKVVIVHLKRKTIVSYNTVHLNVCTFPQKVSFDSSASHPIVGEEENMKKLFSPRKKEDV